MQGEMDFSNISLSGATDFTFEKLTLCSEKIITKGMNSLLSRGVMSSSCNKGAQRK